MGGSLAGMGSLELSSTAVSRAGVALSRLTAGYVVFRLLVGVNEYLAEIMVTLALVLGGYALASALHVAGPIAMVVAGLLFAAGTLRVFSAELPCCATDPCQSAG